MSAHAGGFYCQPTIARGVLSSRKILFHYLKTSPAPTLMLEGQFSQVELLNKTNQLKMNMEHIINGEQAPKRKRGRPKKNDILKYRYMIRLTDKENQKFLSMFKQSGQKSKSKFIADCVLNHKLKVIEVNKSAIDFVIQLTQFFVQFRAIKNNYNQLFVALVRNSGEDKARFMMKILDKSTLEFIQTMKEFECIVTQLKEKCLLK